MDPLDRSPSSTSSAAQGSLDEVVALIHRGRRFLCTCHVSPDGDALGSMLATGLGLRTLGKEVVFYNRDRAPERLRGLPSAGELVQAVPAGPFDATFVHDAGDPRLLGDRFPPPEVSGKVVVLDHHAASRPYGDLVVRDPTASAVGLIVGRLLAKLGVALTRPIAEALWCSLVSDTGWFRYPSTDVETLELATACVRAGCSPWGFAQKAEESQPVGRLRLLALVLGTLELHGRSPGRVALLTLNESMLHQAGAPPDAAEGFVNHARGLEGVEVGCLITELRQGVRLSLRSKGAVDVGQVAAALGGGGHRGAAGCTLMMSLEQARRTLLAALGVAS